MNIVLGGGLRVGGRVGGRGGLRLIVEENSKNFKKPYKWNEKLLEKKTSWERNFMFCSIKKTILPKCLKKNSLLCWKIFDLPDKKNLYKIWQRKPKFKPKLRNFNWTVYNLEINFFACF